MTALSWLKPPLRAARTAWRAARAQLGVTPSAAPTPRHAAPPERSATAFSAAPAGPALRVEIEETPNPNARKLVVNRALLTAGTVSASSPAEAAGHPITAALFEVPGVSTVLLARDFVTVTRQPGFGWATLEPALRAALERATAA
jgi:hypothetical protein